jgi:hypothetical protein
MLRSVPIPGLSPDCENLKSTDLHLVLEAGQSEGNLRASTDAADDPQPANLFLTVCNSLAPNKYPCNPLLFVDPDNPAGLSTFQTGADAPRWPFQNQSSVRLLLRRKRPLMPMSEWLPPCRREGTPARTSRPLWAPAVVLASA